MPGLPGDFTPPSRFVRAAAFATSVEPGQTGDYTVWTSANDLARRRFLFRNYHNSQFRSVDLMTLDLNASTSGASRCRARSGASR